jgi:hypothetical protein
MTDAELDAHIRDTGEHLKRAYARFQDSGLPADRDEALQWWQAERDALLLRSERFGSARHAAFEAAVGSAWFASDEAQAMGRSIG